MKVDLLSASLLALIMFLCAGCGRTEGKKEIKTADVLPASDFVFRKLSPGEERYYSQAAKAAYEKMLGKTGFNGSILVAKNGQIVFEDYKGFSNFKTKDSITYFTPFHLASISKTFTGMAILKLWEQGRLSLDDSLQTYFPGLPYRGITVRMLLAHRSGLPNYLYFMETGWDKKKKATNQDVLDYMITHQPPIAANPGRSFNYCNTNYVLLALILEKITHTTYPQYLKDSLFAPLGMNSSFVFSINDTAKYVPTYAGNRPYPMDHLDCTYGDKNIYSTVRDLLIWDKSVYENRYVTKATLDSAFVPQSNERPSMHNYGLGWRLFFNKGDTIIYHNGKWHGSNTVFDRFVQDTATIIILGNKYNRAIYQAKTMGSIFTGKEDKIVLEE